MDLGLKPTLLSMTLIDHLFEVVERHRDRVDLAAIMPTVSWRATTSELPRYVQRAGPDVNATEAGSGAGLSGRRILVTGGSGFIGRHAVAELSRAGAHVRVVDLKPHPDPDVEIVQGDLGGSGRARGGARRRGRRGRSPRGGDVGAALARAA